MCYCGCTHNIMVFSTKLSIIFSTKTFIDGKTTCGYPILQPLEPNGINNLHRQRPFITSNIKSSNKPTCVGSFFLNSFEVEKNLEIVDKETWGFFFVNLLIKWSFHWMFFYQLLIREERLALKCFFIIVISQYFYGMQSILYCTWCT
jgi:hypothetical protein